MSTLLLTRIGDTSTSSSPESIERKTREIHRSGMAHPVYILIFPSPLFPAHWSLFIPSVSPDRTTDNPTQTGTRIHVHGDAKSGFAPEFVRNYDTFASVDGDKLVWLADIEEQYMPIVDGPPSKDNGKHGEECRDIEAGNELERIALTVPAPGPSLTSVGAQVRFNQSPVYAS